MRFSNNRLHNALLEHVVPHLNNRSVASWAQASRNPPASRASANRRQAIVSSVELVAQIIHHVFAQKTPEAMIAAISPFGTVLSNTQDIKTYELRDGHVRGSVEIGKNSLYGYADLVVDHNSDGYYLALQRTRTGKVAISRLWESDWPQYLYAPIERAFGIRVPARTMNQMRAVARR